MNLPVYARWLAAGVATALVVRAWPDGETPWVWWSMRSLGLLALFASWLAMVFGVFVSARGAGGVVNPPIVVVLHRTWATLAAVTTVLHVLAAIADPRISVFAAVIPLTSSVLRGGVTLGTVALLLGSALFWSQRLERSAWRAVHAAAFGGFLLAVLHAVFAGTDAPPLRFLYAAATAVLVGAVLQRVAVTAPESKRA